MRRPMPWPIRSVQIAKPRSDTALSTAAPSWFRGAPARGANATSQAFGCRRLQTRLGLLVGPDGHRDARVGVETVKLGGHVELDQIAAAQSPLARDSMDSLIVDANAVGPWKAVIQLRTRTRPSLPENRGSCTRCR